MTRGALEDLGRQVAESVGIPPTGWLAQVARESAWNPIAVGSAGELGLSQIKAGTMLDMGGNPGRWTDPEHNMSCGAAYLREQYDRFHSWSAALAAYNWGPGALSRSDAVAENGVILSRLPASVRDYVEDLAPAYGDAVGDDFAGTPEPGSGLGLAALVGLSAVGYALWRGVRA